MVTTAAHLKLGQIGKTRRAWSLESVKAARELDPLSQEKELRLMRRLQKPGL